MTVDKREERRERRRTLVNLYQKWDIQVAAGAGGVWRRIGGQTSERAKPRQMRHASVDNISTCGMRAKLSTG